MFLDEGFRCSENGRPDNFYTKWRWQPKDCNLPRFDAKLMLEKLRDKRLAFVGDSIGRNQWESLLCMLSSAVPNKTSIYEVNGRPIAKHTGFLIFKFPDFNCTVEYYRAPFLVLQSRCARECENDSEGGCNGLEQFALEGSRYTGFQHPSKWDVTSKKGRR